MRKLILSLLVSACAACVHHHPSADIEIKGNLEAMREGLPAHVTDPVRSATIARAIDAMREQLVEFESISQEFHEQAIALNSRPDTTRAQFEELLQKYDTRRVDIRDEVARLHFQMIDATTAEEWKSLSKYEGGALAAVAGG